MSVSTTGAIAIFALAVAALICTIGTVIVRAILYHKRTRSKQHRVIPTSAALRRKDLAAAAAAATATTDERGPEENELEKEGEDGSSFRCVSHVTSRHFPCGNNCVDDATRCERCNAMASGLWQGSVMFSSPPSCGGRSTSSSSSSSVAVVGPAWSKVNPSGIVTSEMKTSAGESGPATPSSRPPPCDAHYYHGKAVLTIDHGTARSCVTTLQDDQLFAV